MDPIVPGSIVLPASTLAEFIRRAVARYGTLRGAAIGIGVPYSTLRGWMRRRVKTALKSERSGDDLFERVFAMRAALEAVNENIAALRAHLDAILRMTGRG